MLLLGAGGLMDVVVLWWVFLAAFVVVIGYLSAAFTKRFREAAKLLDAPPHFYFEPIPPVTVIAGAAPSAPAAPVASPIPSHSASPARPEGSWVEL